MRVSCERDHERVSMDWDHMGQMYICSTCHYKTTVEVCESFIPVAYRNPRDPLVRLLMGLSKETQDFEVEVVIGMTWPPKIEYPRPSLDDKFEVKAMQDVEVVGPQVTMVHKDEVDLSLPTSRSGSFVVKRNHDDAEREFYSAWERFFYDNLPEREPKGWDVKMWVDEQYESDPLLQTAPRGLFTRETWQWIKDVIGYTWRLHTGRLRVVRPKIAWNLNGVKIDSIDFGFSAFEKKYEL